MIAVLLAVLVLAGGPVPPTEVWTRYPCTTGIIDPATATFVPTLEPGVFKVDLHGEVGCGVPEAGPKFGLALYPYIGGPGTINQYTGLVEYATPGGPTSFQIAGGIRRGELIRMCVLSDYAARLSCVAVASSEDGAMKAVTIETDDPSVAAPAELNGSEPNPQCASCWTMRR